MLSMSTFVNEINNTEISPTQWEVLFVIIGQDINSNIINLSAYTAKALLLLKKLPMKSASEKQQ